MYIITDKSIFSLDTIKGVTVRGNQLKMVVTAKEAFNEISKEYMIYEFDSPKKAEAAFEDLIESVKAEDSYWDVKEYLNPINKE